MVRVCVGCWHLMKWCSFRLTVVCVCVYPVLLYAFVGLAGGLGFAWFLGVPKVRYATPEKQRFWSRFGSQLGGVLAQKGVVFFDACGGFRWTVCVCWVHGR